MHALIIGERNAGKTTLINRIVKSLGVSVSGYVTLKETDVCDEQYGNPIYIYEAGKQRIQNTNNLIGYCKDEQPTAFKEAFDRYAKVLMSLPNESDVIVMDEIGNMERCSENFCEAVLKLLDGKKTVIAAVKNKTSDYLDKVKNHPNCKCFYLSENNRDKVYCEVMEFIEKYKFNTQISTVNTNRYMANKDISKEDVILAKEVHVNMSVNGNRFFQMVSSPVDIKEMCVGRAVSEGLITEYNQVENLTIDRDGETILVTMNIDDNKECSRKASKKSNKEAIDPNDIFAMLNAVGEYQQMHKMTGGTHSCALLVKNTTVKCFEDIGRHNALDKAIGYAYMNSMDMTNCVLYFTGRVMCETVEKVVNAHVTTLITKAVPTDDAVRKAKENNINLICRAWSDSFDAYLPNKL